MVVATVPISVGGLVVSLLGVEIRSPMVIAVATIAFGLLLWWADRRGGERDEHALGLRDAVVVGLAQTLALIPGTSRSGITITAALAVGMSREGAARFSFLLSIPAIALAGAAKTVEAIASEDAAGLAAMLAGAVIAGVSAYLCIAAFLRLVARIGLTPFVLYRLVLGAVLIGVYV